MKLFIAGSDNVTNNRPHRVFNKDEFTVTKCPGFKGLPCGRPADSQLVLCGKCRMIVSSINSLTQEMRAAMK